MLGEKQKAFRQNYRSRIAGWYNGIIHVAVIYIIGITAMWIYIQHIECALVGMVNHSGDRAGL